MKSEVSETRVVEFMVGLLHLPRSLTCTFLTSTLTT